MFYKLFDYLVCTVFGAWGKSGSFGFTHGLYVFMVFVNASHLRRVGLREGQSQMCHLCGGRNYSRHYCFSKVFVNASHFNFLCGRGVLFFLGTACVSPSWSVGLCRDTAKLSAEYGRSKSLVRMSKVDGFGVTLMVAVSSNRLAYNSFLIKTLDKAAHCFLQAV